MALHALKNAIVSRRSVLDPVGAKGQYEAIVVGDGLAALACAYYLTVEFGMADVAVWGGRPLPRWAPLFVGGVGPDPTAGDPGRREVELCRQLVQETDNRATWQRRGHLWLALNGQDEAALRRWRAVVELSGGVCRWLTPAEAARMCPPAAGASLAAALYLPGGGWVDGAGLAESLAAALRRRGVFWGQGPAPVVVEGGQVCGVRSAAGLVQTDRLVLACGETASRIDGVELEPVDYLCGLTEPLPPALGPAVLCPGRSLRAVQDGAGVYIECVAPARSGVAGMAGLGDILGPLPGLGRVSIARTWRRRRWRIPGRGACAGPSGESGLFFNLGWDAAEVGLLSASRALAERVAREGVHAT